MHLYRRQERGEGDRCPGQRPKGLEELMGQEGGGEAQVGEDRRGFETDVVRDYVLQRGQEVRRHH